MGTKKEMLKNANNDIRDYKQLGFSDDSELIQLLHGRLQRIENRITQLQNQTFMNTKNAPTQNRKQLQQIVALNKKMLQSYLQDVQELRRLGIPTSHDIISFSHDKIVRLTIALAELERQLNTNIFNTHNEYTQRLVRMQEISQQSIAQFKEELQTYVDKNGAPTHEKIQFVKEQITKKTRALHQLEELLMRY